jgi:hypothetical protein
MTGCLGQDFGTFPAAVDESFTAPHVDASALDTMITTPLNELIVGIQQRLADQLPAADLNGWIAGRPVTITPLDQQTIELVFHGVPQVSEAEVRAVRRVLDMPAFCSVAPEGRSSLRVTFLCHVP